MMIGKKSIAIALLIVSSIYANAQKDLAPPDAADDGMGISVSPSTLRYNVKPGATQTKTVKISNDTKNNVSFQVSFQDLGIGKDGKQSVPVSSEYKNALSKYIVVSPTLVELKSKESKIVTVTLDIPPGDAYAIAMWTTLVLDQVSERPKMELPNLNNNTMGMGINTTMGFGVSIFQNPPNVVVNSVDIQSMKYIKGGVQLPNSILMKAKNTGDGIGYCLYYLELTNLLTGKQIKLKVKQFGIFPGYEKELSFDLPKELEKGKYSALAVLDFGNKEELRTAELEFTID